MARKSPWDRPGDGQSSRNVEEKSSLNSSQEETIISTNEKPSSLPDIDSTLVSERLPPTFAESESHHIQRRQVNPTRATLWKWSKVPSRYPNLSNAWEFAGWGSTYYMELERSDIDQFHTTRESRNLIGQWRATSIAGNDLIASVLYSIGPCVLQAGKYAPISMLLVALLMYPMKRIITEVATALPLNGGCYNAMLNTTSKTVAAVAACLSILDYLATCVVSASTASAYLAAEVELPSNFSAFVLTIIILIVFSLVCILGLRESSTLTLSIFTIHLITMAAVMVASIVMWGRQGNSVLIENWNMPDPEGTTPIRMIFNGFCIGLLGVTGFESAENYIEDLKPNTFPKVMNNMFSFLFIINAPMTLLVVVLVPVPVIQANAANAVSILGQYAVGGNRWLRVWIMVDAVIVLCAGVLTGLIGAIGLVQRMASDRILPRLFLIRNRWTGSYQYIVLAFLVLSITMYAIVGGDTKSLSGVFAVAFLCSLSTFAAVNILMKYKRGRLARFIKVNLLTSMATLGVLISSLIGNIIIDPEIAEYFIIYFCVVLIVVLIMLRSAWLFKLCYWLFDQMDFFHRFKGFSKKAEGFIKKRIQNIRKDSCAFFLKTDEPHVMNKAVQYIKHNEDCGHIKFIHIYDKAEDIPELMENHHRTLDEIYPKIQIDLLFIKGTFDPATVDAISRQLEIPKSFMFISCPGKEFEFNFGDFEGVRIIML